MVDVAGPLCFQGDYQAKDVELPPPEDGDILAIHDTGAYTMSMYCRCATTRAMLPQECSLNSLFSISGSTP